MFVLDIKKKSSSMGCSSSLSLEHFPVGVVQSIRIYGRFPQ